MHRCAQACNGRVFHTSTHTHMYSNLKRSVDIVYSPSPPHSASLPRYLPPVRCCSNHPTRVPEGYRLTRRMSLQLRSLRRCLPLSPPPAPSLLIRARHLFPNRDPPRTPTRPSGRASKPSGGPLGPKTYVWYVGVVGVVVRGAVLRVAVNVVLHVLFQPVRDVDAKKRPKACVWYVRGPKF